jgi:proton-dependent oligopeptide transporter, POT family
MVGRLSKGNGSRETGFLGHPPGLAYLAFTEVWEGFSFYGMQALLMLYMVRQLLRPDHAKNVLGLTSLRSGLEGLTGPMTTVAFAAQIFGLYVGLVNVTPLLGGWLGDRWLGQTKTIILGALLMIAGHLSLTSEFTFVIGLALLILGAGFIKGNMAVQIGHLYAAQDPRRTQGFGIYMLVRNIGAMLAPLVCGTLGERWGWQYGFGVAAIAMALALVIYLSGRRYLPPERRHLRELAPAQRLDGAQKRAILALLLAFIPSILMFTAIYQAYTILPVWAVDHVHREVSGFMVPVTWMYTFDGLATMVGIVIGIRVWSWLGKRGREPDDVAKIGIGGLLASIAFAVLAFAASRSGAVSLAWVAAFFVLLDFSFIWGEPPLKSLVSRYAPASRATIMMSLAITSIAIANFTVGWLGRFYERMDPAAFWALHSAIAAAATLSAFLLRPVIYRLVDRKAAA